MQFFSGKITGDTNKIYTDLLNCSPIKPPYREYKYKEYTFYGKREGIKDIYTIDGYEITDNIIIDGGQYFLAVKNDRTKIRVYKEVTGNLVRLYEGDFKKGGYERFFVFDYVKGKKQPIFTNGNTDSNLGKQVNDSGTGASWMEDGSGNDFDSNIIGKYLYVYGYKNSNIETNDGLAGQVNIIMDVKNNETPKKIIVKNGWVDITNSGDDMKYCVLSDWGKVFGFVTTQGFVHWVYDNNTEASAEFILNEQMSLGVNRIINYITEHKGIIFLLDGFGNIFYGFKGLLKTYFKSVNQLQVNTDTNSIISFQDYIITNNGYSMGVITVQFDDNTNTYNIQQYGLSNTIGLYTKYSYTLFQNQLYIISSDKNFYSVSITPVSSDKFVPKFEPQSYYIVSMLEELGFSDINIRAFKNNVYIFAYTDTGSEQFTTIFFYDKFYGQWFRRVINGDKIVNYNVLTNRYYGSKIYVQSGYQDSSGGYSQKIRFIFGEDKIGAYKYYHFIKIILGKNSKISNQDTKIISRTEIGGDKNEIIFDNIQNIGYMQKLNSLGNSGLGNNILGGLTLGQGNSIEDIIGCIGSIRFDLNQVGDIYIGEIETHPDDRIEFGGFLLGYDYIEGNVESLDNIYTF